MAFKFADNMTTTLVASGTREDPLMLEANVVKCPDGSLFCSWTCGGDKEPLEKNYVSYSRSLDGGKSWKAADVLFMHPGKGMFCPEAVLIDGKIFTFPGAYNDYYDTSFCQDFMSFVSESRDYGQSFCSPHFVGGGINGIHVKNVYDFGDRIIGAVSWIECEDEIWASFENANKKCIVSGREIRGKSCEGKIIFPHPLCHSEYCGVIISFDRGKSWRICGKIGKRGMNLCEPVIGELSDKSLCMLMRNNAEAGLYMSRSYNRGESWSKAKKTDIPSTIVKVSLVKDGNGKFYLLNHASNNKYDRTELNLWVSSDDMKSWSEKCTLIKSDDGTPCTYPDAFIDGERGMLCFGWDDRKNIYYSEYAL